MVGGAIVDSAPTTDPRVRAFPSRGFSEYGPLSLTPCAVNGVVAVSMQQCEIFAAVVGVITVAMVHFWLLDPCRSSPVGQQSGGFERTDRTKRMKPSIAAHQALPAVGLHGLALAGYPPRR
jgi:hypothetical protein